VNHDPYYLVDIRKNGQHSGLLSTNDRELVDTITYSLSRAGYRVEMIERSKAIEKKQ
jgi:hypothetical protein